MRMIVNWFKSMIEAFLPKESNAWDEYKRARAMELAPIPKGRENANVIRR